MFFIKSPLLSPPCETAGPRDSSLGVWIPRRFLSCLELFSHIRLVFNSSETFPLANVDYKLYEGRDPLKDSRRQGIIKAVHSAARIFKARQHTRLAGVIS